MTIELNSEAFASLDLIHEARVVVSARPFLSTGSHLDLIELEDMAKIKVMEYMSKEVNVGRASNLHPGRFVVTTNGI